MTSLAAAVVLMFLVTTLCLGWLVALMRAEHRSLFRVTLAAFFAMVGFLTFVSLLVDFSVRS